MDDTSKIFICKKLSSSHTSINPSLIIFIIFLSYFRAKHRERVISLWLMMRHFLEKEANKSAGTLCVNVSRD